MRSSYDDAAVHHRSNTAASPRFAHAARLVVPRLSQHLRWTRSWRPNSTPYWRDGYRKRRSCPSGKQQAAAVSLDLPTSYLVKQNIGGVTQDVRRLTVSVYERAVVRAIGRGLLDRSNRDSPWAVISALFAGMFDGHTIEWLNKRGYLRWDQRGQGEAIIAAVNALIGRHR